MAPVLLGASPVFGAGCVLGESIACELPTRGGIAAVAASERMLRTMPRTGSPRTSPAKVVRKRGDETQWTASAGCVR